VAAPDLHESVPCYYGFKKLEVSDEQFAALYGRPLPASDGTPGEHFTRNSTVADMEHTWVGRRIVSKLRKSIMSATNDADTLEMMEKVIRDMPLRLLLTYGGNDMTPEMLEGMISMLNGHLIKGFVKMHSHH